MSWTPRPTVTKRLRNPRALSSTLASLGTPQPQALGFLNHLVTLVSASNLYIEREQLLTRKL